MSFKRHIILSFGFIDIVYIIYCFNKFYNNIENQNKKLLNQINILYQQMENYHYSEMKSISNNMECILDLDTKGER